MVACLVACTSSSERRDGPKESDSSAPSGHPGADTSSQDSGPRRDLPGHGDCLEEGEAYSDDVCLAVVEEDGRYPGVSEDKSRMDPVLDDPRLSDPGLQWLTSQASRCACACCHTAEYSGPGLYFWDLSFSPVWIDSASIWTLGVLAGWTEEPHQTLPVDDLERLEAVIQAEVDRRLAD